MTCTTCHAALICRVETDMATCTDCFLASLDTSWHSPTKETTTDE